MGMLIVHRQYPLDSQSTNPYKAWQHRLVQADAQVAMQRASWPTRPTRFDWHATDSSRFAPCLARNT